MHVNTFINAPISSNCYVIHQGDSPSCIIIDPSTEDCFEVIDYIVKNRLTPDFIFLTHEHFDHIWGVNRLKELYDVQLICSKSCSDAIVNNKTNFSLFFNQKGFVLAPADKTVEKLDGFLTWNNVEIEFIGTPGHSPGSICVFMENLLFTGDTLIKNTKTVTKLKGGNVDALKASLLSIEKRFCGGQVCVYPGHGEKFVLNEKDIKAAL